MLLAVVHSGCRLTFERSAAINFRTIHCPWKLPLDWCVLCIFTKNHNFICIAWYWRFLEIKKPSLRRCLLSEYINRSNKQQQHPIQLLFKTHAYLCHLFDWLHMLIAFLRCSIPICQCRKSAFIVCS